MPRIKYLSSGEISEESIQKSIVHTAMEHPKLCKLVLHFPNEGKRSPRYGKLMKDLGMRPGVADLFLPAGRHGFIGAWIEVKSVGGTVSPLQKLFLEDMAAENYFTAVCWSINEGLNLLEWYCLAAPWKPSAAARSQYRTQCQQSQEPPHGTHFLPQCTCQT